MAKKQPRAKAIKSSTNPTTTTSKDDVLENELVVTIENNKEENQKEVQVGTSTDEVTSKSLTTLDSTSEKEKEKEEDKEDKEDDEDKDESETEFSKILLKKFNHDKSFKKVFKKIKKSKKILKLLDLKKGHKKMILQSIKDINHSLEKEIFNKEFQKCMELDDQEKDK